MDWNQVLIAVAGAIVGAISGIGAAYKTVLPRIIESRIEERLAKIRAEAEEAAYERNRAATREDKAFTLLEDSIEAAQKYIDILQEAQMNHNKTLARIDLQLVRNNDFLRGINGNVTGVHDAVRQLVIREQLRRIKEGEDDSDPSLG